MNALANTKLDDFPEDFTLEDLKRGLTPQEVEAIQADPEVALADPANPAPAAAEAAPAPAAQPAPAPQPEAPKIVVPDTTAALAVIAKADADLAAATERYDAGEITRAELLEATKAIVAEQAKAQVVVEQAQQAVQQIQQTVEQQWFAAGDAFKAVPGNEVLWSPEHIKGWDQALRTVSGTPDYQNLPMNRQYELAKDFYAADYKARTGQALPISGSSAPPAPAGTPGVPDKARTDPRDPPVQTLGGINGDATSMVTDGTFAAIDRMMDENPIKAEAMIAALTPSQQEQFFAI